MRRASFFVIGMILLSTTLLTETLGFFEQKFTSINFEKDKWARTTQLPCQVYTALEDGSMVDVMRYGTSNLVPFRAMKNAKVTVCGSTAAFDEGFEAKIRPL